MNLASMQHCDAVTLQFLYTRVLCDIAMHLWCSMNRPVLQLSFVVKVKLGSKLNSYSSAKSFFIAFSHKHSHFWGHKCLSNSSISNQHVKSDAAPWVEKDFNFMRVLWSWHDSIGHLIGFYRWTMILSLNRIAVTYQSEL